MGDTKNIVLIINASNFERQKDIIKVTHKILKSRGGYTLYALSNYGPFMMIHGMSTAKALFMTC